MRRARPCPIAPEDSATATFAFDEEGVRAQPSILDVGPGCLTRSRRLLQQLELTLDAETSPILASKPGSRHAHSSAVCAI
jgi:hypothetical protein